MSDVHRCDACGAIRFMHNSNYSLSSKVSDIEVSSQAVDIRGDGHLCDDCAMEVAKLIKELGDD